LPISVPLGIFHEPNGRGKVAAATVTLIGRLPCPVARDDQAIQGGVSDRCPKIHGGGGHHLIGERRACLDDVEQFAEFSMQQWLPPADVVHLIDFDLVRAT
jgi:hypothetical protein